jgi:hypothetical protein
VLGTAVSRSRVLNRWFVNIVHATLALARAHACSYPVLRVLRSRAGWARHHKCDTALLVAGVHRDKTTNFLQLKGYSTPEVLSGVKQGVNVIYSQPRTVSGFLNSGVDLDMCLVVISFN